MRRFYQIIPLALIPMLALIRTCSVELPPEVENIALSLDKRSHQTLAWMAISMDLRPKDEQKGNLLIVRRDNEINKWIIYEQPDTDQLKNSELTGWFFIDFKNNRLMPIKHEVVQSSPYLFDKKIFSDRTVSGTNVLNISSFWKRIPQCNVLYIRNKNHIYEFWRKERWGEASCYSLELFREKFTVIGEAKTFAALIEIIEKDSERKSRETEGGGTERP